MLCGHVLVVRLLKKIVTGKIAHETSPGRRKGSRMRKLKGSRPQEQLVPIAEAAKLVGMTERTLHSMTERGVLEAIHPEKRGPKHFRMHDISALAELRLKKMDLPTIADLAMQAYVTARANSRRVDDLYYLLGFDSPVLGTTEEEVIALYIRAQEAGACTRDLPAESVHEWAGIFYAVDEAYLELVLRHTGSDEPWKVFVDLANTFLSEMPTDSFSTNPPLKSAYAYLSIARTNLRTASYYFCRHRFGIATAGKVFRNDAADPIEGIVRLMFPPLSKVFR
jgi:hypothetical protein